MDVRGVRSWNRIASENMFLALKRVPFKTSVHLVGAVFASWNQLFLASLSY